jgi:protein-tyrosine phosphatase
VFVHCSAGVERSPTVVAAHLAWHQGHDLEDAAHLIRAARPIAAPRLAVIRACGRGSIGG